MYLLNACIKIHQNACECMRMHVANSMTDLLKKFYANGGTTEKITNACQCIEMHLVKNVNECNKMRLNASPTECVQEVECSLW